MNITPLTIYLWQLADQLKDFSKVVVIMLLISCAIVGFASTYPEMESDTRHGMWRWCRKLLIAAASFGFTATLLPSSSTIAMMVVVPEIAHSKVIQQDLPDIYNAAVDALKNQLKK